MSNDEIKALIQAKKFGNANDAIFERIRKTGVSAQVASAALFYCHEKYHDAGDDEVSNEALYLMMEVFDVDNRD